MTNLHSPLQHLLESGFRASRSPVGVRKGNAAMVRLNVKAPPPPQSFSVLPGVPPAHSEPKDGISHTEYQAARFIAPPDKQTGSQSTYDYVAQRSTTAVSYSENILFHSAAVTFDKSFESSGRSSAPAVAHALVKQGVTTSVLKTVLEVSTAGSSSDTQAIWRSRQHIPQNHPTSDLNTAGQSSIKDQPSEDSYPVAVAPVLPSLPPDVPPNDDQRLAALEAARQLVMPSTDRENQLNWAEDVLNCIDNAMLDKMWVASHSHLI
jgi:hypothetical protein